MDRRDLLKLFGVGAVAVPVVRGVPLINTQAKIIEPAKVEPVESVLIPPTRIHPSEQEPSLISVEVWSPDGRHSVFTAKTFFCTPTYEYSNLQLPFSSAPSMRYVKDKKLFWTLKGECLVDEQGQLAQIVSYNL